MKVLLLGGPHNETVREIKEDWIPHGMFLKAADGSDVFYRARVLSKQHGFRQVEVQLYTTEDVVGALTPDIVDHMLRKHGLYPYAQPKRQRYATGGVYRG